MTVKVFFFHGVSCGVYVILSKVFFFPPHLRPVFWPRVMQVLFVLPQGKKVPGNDIYAANLVRKRRYRYSILLNYLHSCQPIMVLQRCR